MKRSNYFSNPCSLVLYIALLCGNPAIGELCLPEVPDPGAQASATASIEFLVREMDRCHETFVVYDDVSSACNHFPLFGAIGNDLSALDVFGSWTDDRHGGATSIRFDFTDSAVANWGGFYFLNGILPDGAGAPLPNWGDTPDAGVTIPEAVELSFWVKGLSGGTIEFFMGGVGYAHEPHHSSTPKHPRRGLKISLEPEWRRFTIPMTGVDTSYILGGFGWVTNDTDSPGGASFLIDDIEYILTSAGRAERLALPRFVRSFTTRDVQPIVDGDDDDIDFVLRNLAFSYDNALTLLAFLAIDTADGLERARRIGDAFVVASLHDRFFDDGRIRTAYAAGDLVLPPGWTPNGRIGTVAIPGYFNEAGGQFVEVEQKDTDVGNNSWVMSALLALYERTDEVSYLDAARRIGEWIRACRNDSGTYQGFQGGISDPEGMPTRDLWASGEHNLDVVAAFTEMAHFDPAEAVAWLADAAHARTFVETLWNPVLGCYVAGTTDPEHRNDTYDQVPLDIQTWSTLALPDALTLHPDLLACVEAHHRTSDGGVAGYDFNTDRDAVWFEGTAQAALAYLEAGGFAMAEPILETLRCAQRTEPFGDGEHLVAATLDGLTTGFDFRYFQRPHIAAASWNVFAQRAFNPYYQRSIADLEVTMTDGRDNIAAGSATSYKLVASNVGPAAWVKARLRDTLPPALLSAMWTCDESGGGLCAAASGAGTFDLMISLPLGTSVQVTIDATVAPSFRGALSYSTTLEPVGRARDPLADDNLATDLNTVVEPDDWLFGNGFESGNLAAWSSHSRGAARARRAGRSAVALQPTPTSN